MKVQAGTAEAVYHNQKDNPLSLEPVFQIIKFEKVDQAGEEKPRVRVNLSDGVHYIKGILSSSYTGHFDKGMIKNLSLVKLGTYYVRSYHENYFVYIQKLEEFEDCSKKVGNPVSITTKKNSLPDPVPQVETRDVDLGRTPTKKAKMEEGITPVAAINPFLNKWTIKGRVVLKSDVRKFTTQKGEGKIFSLEIVDESAQIKLVAFNDAVDIFYPIFEVGKAYQVSKGVVKMANKQYANNNMDYEIHLDKTTEVNQVQDGSEPKYFFNFTSIKDLAVGNQLLDVIGVVRDVYPVSTVVIKSTQKENKKRDIILMDESGSVRVTLWGAKVEIEFDENPVVAIKSARAGEYNGVNLSTINSTQILINPDMDRAFELKGWFDKTGKDLKVVLPRKDEKRNYIQEVKDNELEYSFLVGMFIYIKEDHLWYDSCPGENCTKKVVLEDGGKYRCEKCNNTYDNCDQRYMASVHVADFSGQLWVSMFNEIGVALFGLTAPELKELGDNSPAQIQNIVKALYFKEYGMKVRGKQDFYNNEARMRYNVLSLAPINVLTESKKMIEQLNKLMC